ncbi:S41 family peptidase [Sulfidibacter corallicola]|uniref:PDZ domain-containing protein n=1 Tax=Sulfidibacter corallicola TaxID=2818388 RepID=A0A8A4TXX7_SULCO|nr:S41 family peptidase [Sulfidibacter corallicola]QTD54081.1 PDZ domain-containing protein [Sulfidibacter corallicola]
MFLILAAFLAPMPVRALEKAPPKDHRRVILDRLGEILVKEGFALGVDFRRWSDHVDKYRDRIRAAQDEQEFLSVVNQALAEFGISHLKLKTKRQMRRKRQGTKYGIGLFPMPQEKGLLVTWVVPDSPADQAGLRPGDLILSVDHQDVDDPADVLTRTGKNREFMWMHREKPRQAEIRDALFRQEELEPARILNGDLLLIRIPSFDSGIYHPKKVAKLFESADTARVLMLDMRSNPGGDIDHLKHLLSLLFPSGTPLFHEIRAHHLNEAGLKPRQVPEDVSGFLKQRFSRDQPLGRLHKAGRYRSYPSVPVVVLVDHWTASSAEIFAAVVQEHQRGVVIGSPTQGLVLPSMTFSLPHGFRVQVPVSDLVTFGGRRLENDPVIPDHPLPPQKTANEEQLILAVLEYLDL